MVTKETKITYNKDGTTTDATIIKQGDGSGTKYEHTHDNGFIFKDTVSRSKTDFGPSKKET